MTVLLFVVLKKDTSKNKEEALKEIYKKLRPGEPPHKANAEALINSLFLDTKRYDLAKVGRHMLNLKLGLGFATGSPSYNCGRFGSSNPKTYRSKAG